MFYRTFPLTRLATLRQAHFPPLLRALLILTSKPRTLPELARILGKRPADLRLPLGMLREMQMIDARPRYTRRPSAAPGYGATHRYGSTLAGRQTRPLRVAA